ncbi:MAG: tripartite tricarboxylate transporter permease [Desulfarculaceae bacterium]
MGDILGNLWQGAQYAASLVNILAIIIGYIIGVVAGAIPGVMAVTAMVLILPFTFTLDPLFAIAMLMGTYKGGAYAGSITATLVNIPGTPEAAATALDSYPMSQAGEQQRALELALWASVIGGTISNFLLIFTAPPLAEVALRLGPAEIASLILFSLTAVITLLGDSRMDMWKGFISITMGLMLAIVGLDNMSATRRYVFGFEELDNGVPFVLTIIALLALSEVFIQSERVANLRINRGFQGLKMISYSWKQRWLDFKLCLKDLVRSSFVGSLLGALPGIGATTAAFVCYGEARRSAKDNSKFGKGDPRGIAAPEAGNNAVAASSLIPLVTLGIPGSVAAAVMYGAFMIQGMIPGPMLMQERPEVIYGLFVLLIMTDFIGAFAVALPFISLCRRLFRKLDFSLFFPGVMVCCVVGVYSEDFNVFHLRLFLVLGCLGYLMRKTGFSIPPFILAFILGPILERNTRTALLLSEGSPMIFITSPVAAILLALALASFVWALWRKAKAGKSNLAVPEEFKH